MTPLPEVDNLTELATCLWGLGVGAALCLVFDLLRCLRLFCPPRRGALFWQDVGYGVFCAPVIFGFLLVRCDGCLRLFPLLGLTAGWWLCRLTLSRAVVAAGRRLATLWRRLCGWWSRRITGPVKRAEGRFCRFMCKKTAAAVKKLKKRSKKVPFSLKKLLHWPQGIVYNQHNYSEYTLPGPESPPVPRQKRGKRPHESRRQSQDQAARQPDL